MTMELALFNIHEHAGQQVAVTDYVELDLATKQNIEADRGNRTRL